MLKMDVSRVGISRETHPSNVTVLTSHPPVFTLSTKDYDELVSVNHKKKSPIFFY